MANPIDNFLSAIATLFRGKKAPGDTNLTGSMYPMSVGSSRAQRMSLDLPELPLRAINGDLQLAYDLVELKTWSYEFKFDIGARSRDCFMQQDGMIGSWSVAKTLADGSPVNADVLVIGRDLANRMSDEEYVLGGDRLQRAARDLLWSGDMFMDFAIEREGLGGKGDWGFSKSLYLPPLAMFVDQDAQGNVLSYSQRSSPQPRNTDIVWADWQKIKLLHLSYEKQGAYGSPPGIPCAEYWRKAKEAAIDLEEASRSVGITPLLHIMPENRSNTSAYKEAYRQELESQRREGPITDMFLFYGSDVRKAAGGDQNLEALIKVFLQWRYGCLLPGTPLWSFPGFGLESSSGKDIANQPALVYYRAISDLRSLLGKGVRKILTRELILRKGYEWTMESGAFDIEWPQWFITGQESSLMNGSDPSDDSSSTDAPEDPNQVSDRLLREVVTMGLLSDPDMTDLPAIKVKLTQLDAALASGRLSQDRFQALLKMGDRLRQTHKKLTGSNGHGATYAAIN
jgi:hypothetical protein